jgi:predicted XRE-type DNA-binding protein
MTSDTYTLDDIERNAEQVCDRPTMSELRAVAREIETMIRKRLSGGHQKEVALDMGISESKMSRAVSGEGGFSIADIALFMAVLRRRGVHVAESSDGLMLVPAERLAALSYLAKEALK